MMYSNGERLTSVQLCTLQRLTGDTIDEQIDQVIVQPLSALEAGPAVQPYRFTPETLGPDEHPTIPSTCAEQFIQDLCLYGLHEAIIYMASYDIDADINSLIDQAVSLYHEIAASYVAHEAQLVTSQDEKICNLMGLADNMEPELPNAPQPDVPMHPFAAELRSELFGLEPASAPDHPTQVADFIRDTFMFDAFPGYIQGVYQVATIMQTYGIDPQDADGQQVLSAYITDVTDDLFGDFNRYALCRRCGDEFTVEISLAFANRLLSDGILCAACSAPHTDVR